MNPIVAAAVCFLLALIQNTHSQLFPIDGDAKGNIYDILIPTKRKSLDDCATRYYRYGRDNLASPVLGTPVELSEYAHFAAIGWTELGNIEWKCGGTLISDNFVLSAAHCTSAKGIPPDKALLGDRFPYSTKDDEFAQYFDIVEVIVHEEYKSSGRYYDIALFKLGTNIRPHKTVLPACLWSLDNYLDFKKLEAAGIGQVGYLANKTDRLEKVTVSPLELETCREYFSPESDRKLKQGLVDHQLCARDNSREDIRQDTCLGDSGGPLQIKLLGNGRMTSFIVGVTSFGHGCGSETPGVYTKVSSFLNWIESKVGISFDPRRCALRYVSLREFQPGLLELGDRISDQGTLTLEDYRSNWINSKIHLARDYRHKAYLGWKKQNYIHWYCGASLISERWLLTAAHCIDTKPDIASVGGLRPHSHAEDHLNQKRDIEEIIPYPSYQLTDVYHDIALIKLKDDVKISLDIVPACIWKKDRLPTDTYEIVGWGSRTSNLFFIDLPVWEVGNDEVFPIVTSECDAVCQVQKTKPLEARINNPTSDEVRYLEVNSTILDNKECNEYYVKYNNTQIKDDQLCIQNDLYSVPGICDLDIGGPVERKVWAYNEYDSYVFGVNSFGKNCGFGTPIVATRVSSYAEWIEKTILGVSEKPSKESSHEIIFVDESVESTVGDNCFISGTRERGVCAYTHQCPGYEELYRSKRQQLSFCTIKPTPQICCPASIVPKFDNNMISLRNCKNNYHDFRPKPSKGSPISHQEHNKIFTHTAAIGFLKVSTVEYKCWGALISENFVLTTASCLTGAGSTPKEVRLGNKNFGLGNEQQIIRVSKIIVHPEYRPRLYYNDIALLGLENSIQPSRNIVPACLWQSENEVPFIGTVPGPSTTRDIIYKCSSTGCNADQEIDKERELLTMQNEDCQKYYNSDNGLSQGILGSQVCAQSKKLNSTDSCLRIPASLYQKGIEDNGVIVPYIIGLYSYDRDCHLDNPAVFTRTSSFIDYIERQINTYA